jgi:hypothetical protein
MGIPMNIIRDENTTQSGYTTTTRGASELRMDFVGSLCVVNSVFTVSFFSVKFFGYPTLFLYNP